MCSWSLVSSKNIALQFLLFEAGVWPGHFSSWVVQLVILGDVMCRLWLFSDKHTGLLSQFSACSKDGVSACSKDDVSACSALFPDRRLQLCRFLTVYDGTCRLLFVSSYDQLNDTAQPGLERK